MGRVLVVVMLIGVVAAGLYALADARRPGRRFDRPSVVLDPYIQANAQDNYVLLEQAVGLLDRVLEADESLPVLSARQRDEATGIVQRFHRRQLG